MDDGADDDLDGRDKTLRPADRRRYTRHVSGVSTTSLPEYRSRHAPSTSLSSTLWDVVEDHPPDYSARAHDVFLRPAIDPTSADEADTEFEQPTPTRLPNRFARGRRKPPALPHRRSRSDQPKPVTSFLRPPESDRERRTDSILERSIQALEMSTALLQSSLSTRDALSSAMLSDEDRGASDDNRFRIDAISRRFASSDVMNAQMEDLLASVEQATGGGSGFDDISQSLPSSSVLHTRSSSQFDHATSSARSESLASHPSRSRQTTPYHSPSASTSQRQFAARASASSPSLLDIDHLPHSPNTAAYALLSSMGVRSPPVSRPQFGGSSGLRSTRASVSDLRSPLSGAPLSARQLQKQRAPAIRAAKSFDSIRSVRQQQNRKERFPKSALASIITPRFFERQAARNELRRGSDAGSSDSPPVLGAETIARLRQLLANHERHSSPKTPVLSLSTDPAITTSSSRGRVSMPSTPSTSLSLPTPSSPSPSSRSPRISPLPSPSPSARRQAKPPPSSFRAPPSLSSSPSGNRQTNGSQSQSRRGSRSAPAPPALTSLVLGLGMSSSRSSEGKLRSTREG